MKVSAVDPTATAAGVRDADLVHIVTTLEPDFREMAGGDLLITGGAGFLGYYLVQAVLSWNDHHPSDIVPVTVFDNFIRGVPGWLGDLQGRRDLTIVQHDIAGPLPHGFGGFEWIVHAAGIATPSFYRAHPIETMDANVEGLRRLLDWAKSVPKLGGFLFFSSSEVYGDPPPEEIPTPESYRGNVSCTGPRACYDESKRYGETLCVNFAAQHGVPVTIVRPFNNYGPGMKITDGRVIADFCRAVIDGRDIEMFSDGTPTRTFCYVADAVTGYYKALVSGRRGEPYNIGTDSPEVSMSELARSIAEIGRRLFGTETGVVNRSSPEADYLVDNPNRRCPRIDKARRELGYEPVYSLQEGITRSLLWYRDGEGAAAA